MKRVVILFLIIGIIGGVTCNVFAYPPTVTVNSVNHGGTDYTDGFSVFFEAGDYTFKPFSGAWNDKYNLSGYWMWNVNIYQPSTSTTPYTLGNNNPYSTATAAFDANKDSFLTINTSGENLWFYISDTSASNNYGEVTIKIDALGGSPPIVPEPISSVLFVTGSAVFAGRAYLKKKRSKTLTHKEVS